MMQWSNTITDAYILVHPIYDLRLTTTTKNNVSFATDHHKIN